MLRKKTKVNARFRHNQMMHSCKFYSFLRDQSLEKWVKYIKILIINKRFYLLTEIFRQPAKIKKFNRLPTKLLNFNRQPTSGPPHSDPHDREEHSGRWPGYLNPKKVILRTMRTMRKQFPVN